MTTEEKTAANKENLLKALEKSLGVVTDACKKAKLSRQVYYDYLREDKDFAASVEDIQDISLDFVESKLFQGIANGDRVLIRAFKMIREILILYWKL